LDEGLLLAVGFVSTSFNDISGQERLVRFRGGRVGIFAEIITSIFSSMALERFLNKLSQEFKI
jgi:hypothetical protein